MITLGSMTTYAAKVKVRLSAIAFDGVNMWTANSIDNSVTRITPEGSMTTYHGTGAKPLHIAFDGVYMWIINAGSENISRISTK